MKAPGCSGCRAHVRGDSYDQKSAEVAFPGNSARLTATAAWHTAHGAHDRLSFSKARNS